MLHNKETKWEKRLQAIKSYRHAALNFLWVITFLSLQQKGQKNGIRDSH